jgi:hypothetical protein
VEKIMALPVSCGGMGITMAADVADSGWVAAVSATVVHAKRSSATGDALSQKYLSSLDQVTNYTLSTEQAISRLRAASKNSEVVPQNLSVLRQATVDMRQRALSQVVAREDFKAFQAVCSEAVKKQLVQTGNKFAAAPWAAPAMAPVRGQQHLRGGFADTAGPRHCLAGLLLLR